jgi:glycosyltransferase involved in cell wall biosynthesis
MAAKIHEQRERDQFAAVVAPAIEDGVVEFLGEVGSSERDELFAGALATIMLGAWPEPFGLVAIESMATGTPVIGRRAGALPEIIEEGRTGFLVDDVEEGRLALERVAMLDRTEVRKRVLTRFSAERMVTDYEAIYRNLVIGGSDGHVTGAPLLTSSRTRGDGSSAIALRGTVRTRRGRTAARSARAT